MTIIRIAAARVTDSELTIWQEDGSTIVIKQPDPRIRPIIDLSLKVCSQGLIAEYDLNGTNTYKEFEEKTGGLVKLFRVAKSFVKHIFAEPTSEPEMKVSPITIGQIPAKPMIQNSDGIQVTKQPEPFKMNRPPIDVTQMKKPEPETKLTSAVEDIMSRAESVSDKNYVPEHTTEEHTIIAVVQNEKGEDRIIPNMEDLKDHFAHASKLGSTKGVELFLQRLTKIIDKRGHSVAELLNFMKRNDLPIADDGSIVAYKALAKQGNKEDVFVDHHSKKVAQKVGSYVFMAEKLVDHRRRTLCSTGLHIARRGYVGGFHSGYGVLTLVKIAPEAVIAVPTTEADKMRVCGYHIVARVPEAHRAQINANQPMTGGENNDAARMLGAVLRGDHVGILEEVEIGGTMGGNLKITPKTDEATANKAVKDNEAKHKTAEPVKTVDDEPVYNKMESGKSIAEAVTEAKSAPVTINSQARALYEAKAWPQLWDFKKKAKKSYEKLGFTDSEIETILKDYPHIPNKETIKALKEAEKLPASKPKVEPVAKTKTASAKVTPQVEPKQKSVVKSKAKVQAESKPVEKKTTESKIVKGAKEALAHAKGKPIPGTKEKKIKVEPKKKEEPMPVTLTGTRAEVARILFEQAIAGDKTRWGTLWRHQKDAKKSWTILGFTDKEIERIKTNKPDYI